LPSGRALFTFDIKGKKSSTSFKETQIQVHLPSTNIHLSLHRYTTLVGKDLERGGHGQIVENPLTFI
jgi:hypothetical protein